MAAKKRNVMFIVFDQLRADCVAGALANAVPLPNLRALADDSAQFMNHYSVANPCGPARASLLTGQYAFNHRAVRNGTPLAIWHPTLPREMRKLGYEPRLYGYTDSARDPDTLAPADPDLTTYEGVMPGFREMLEMRLEESFPWRADLLAKGYHVPDTYEYLFRGVPDPGQPIQVNSPAFYRAEDSDTAFLANELLKSMRVRGNSPWFVHATFIRPHPPLCAPAPYNRMFAPADMPLPNRHRTRTAEAAQHPYIAACVAAADPNNLLFGMDGRLSAESDTDAQALRAIYAGLAVEVDHHFGRIMQYLRESGQLDDTLLIVTADHGEMLGDHYLWGKQTLFDPAYRVPLFMRDPENPDSFGQKMTAISEAIDLTPTILDWMGGTPPAAMNGRSLLGHLNGRPAKDWRDYVYYELDFGEPDGTSQIQHQLGLPLEQSSFAVLREARFKYVHFAGGLPPLLFDMQRDPYEMHNLAENPDYAPEISRLARRMLDHRMRHAYNSHSGRKITSAGVIGH